MSLSVVMNDDALSVSEAVRIFCEVWLRLSNRSQKTVAAYTTDLAQFVRTLPANMELREVARRDVERWLIALQTDEYESASIRRKLASLRAFLRHWVDRGSLAESPLDRFVLRLRESRRLTRVVADGDLQSLLLHFQQSCHQHTQDTPWGVLARRDLAIVRTLCATGIRVGELVGLSCGDILENGTMLRVIGKGRRERIAFLTMAEDQRCLHEYLSVRCCLTPNSDALFVNDRGSRLTTEGVRQLLRRGAKRAGIADRITPHMLRHTAATRFLEHGADVRVVQEYLGHASIRSTERYTHVSPRHLQAVLVRCHPLMPAA